MNKRRQLCMTDVPATHSDAPKRRTAGHFTLFTVQAAIK